MVGLETALASAGFRVLGEQLVDYLKNRGKDELSEEDWAEMGLVIRRKLEVDYENVKATQLTTSRERKIVRKLESAAEIYRELALIGEARGFKQGTIGHYSDLADTCSNWAVRTDGFGQKMYLGIAEDYFQEEKQYRESVS